MSATGAEMIEFLTRNLAIELEPHQEYWITQYLDHGRRTGLPVLSVSPINDSGDQLQAPGLVQRRRALGLSWPYCAGSCPRQQSGMWKDCTCGGARAEFEHLTAERLKMGEI